MQTRSQSRKIAEEMSVNIDFDGASACWKANKTSTGNGSYRYRCLHVCIKGKTCNKTDVFTIDYCKQHYKYHR